MYRLVSVCLLLSVLATPAVTAAGTLRVPGDYSTIQLAINAATHGDTVLVAPGVYFELINFGGKNITVASELGPDVTIIDGNISVDPRFVDAAADDYRLASLSPAIDGGNDSAPGVPPTDLAGNPRIAGAHIDMGAYEHANQVPTASAGADQTLVAGANCQATVTLNGSGSDADGDALTFVWTSEFGSFTGPTLMRSLPGGTHLFTLTVTDGNGGSASDSIVVTVRDETVPTIASVSATPDALSTPNHEFVPVAVAVAVSDACGDGLRCRIVSVTSNEPVAGLWRGDSGPDWEIVGDLSVNLRAERSPKGDGRVYTITVECADASGNTASSTVTVLVPRR
jgi:hypothetical protein